MRYAESAAGEGRDENGRQTLGVRVTAKCSSGSLLALAILVQQARAHLRSLQLPVPVRGCIWLVVCFGGVSVLGPPLVSWAQWDPKHPLQIPAL
jgi:hypothetical protein